MVFRSQNFTKNAKIKKVHENSPRESWEALDRGILHRISARIQPRRRHFAKPLVLESQFFRFSGVFFIIFLVWGLRWGHYLGPAQLLAQIENRLWVVLALRRKPSLGG